ncbi:MAG TPA: hypothetical protein VLL77_03215 [Anaerolineales bacterium]|nr:hypothetical protein [Anaerolineales bacterium]
MRLLTRIVSVGVSILLVLILVAGSQRPNRETADRAQRFTAPIEFDFAGWTLGAIGVKLEQASRGQAGYLTEPERGGLVRDYVRLLERARGLEGEIERIYSDPAVTDPGQAAVKLQAELADLRRQIGDLQPAVEAVLQEQASVVVAASGLAGLGAPFPPVSFHLSQLPLALVISPRETIRQDALIQLVPELTMEEQIALEQAVEQDLRVSALVVPIGGIGTYPTMVQETTGLAWLSEVVLHEWVHNYLTLRPLGWAYDASPETRTMNETVASLVGEALGRAVVERYYPEYLPPPPAPARPVSSPDPQAFDFNAEMHETRLEVDRLLADGKVEEAEDYMEARRQRLVENGYVVRRLNQAYFAFHGAYADDPESAAGADPVGEAVRELWKASDSPAAFLRRMARMNDYADLLTALGRPPTSP